MHFLHLMLIFLGAAGPVTNILVVRQEIDSSNHISSNLQASSKKQGAYPSLEKYAISTDEDSDMKTVTSLGGSSRRCTDVSYVSSHVISNYIKELQVCVS